MLEVRMKGKRKDEFYKKKVVVLVVSYIWVSYLKRYVLDKDV